jgi:hypothetical protein
MESYQSCKSTQNHKVGSRYVQGMHRWRSNLHHCSPAHRHQPPNVPVIDITLHQRKVRWWLLQGLHVVKVVGSCCWSHKGAHIRPPTMHPSSNWNPSTTHLQKSLCAHVAITPH